MKNFPILIFEVILIALFTAAGFSGHKFFFLQGTRSAAITLGIVGMLLCTISVGRFISAAPAHPLSILGYLFGTISMIAFLSQVFRWHIPFFGKGDAALILIAVSMLMNSIIARFGSILTK